MPLATSPRTASSTARAFSLRCVALAQLLALPVNNSDINGQLVSDDGAAAVALGEFDTFDLRRQLAPFNHRIRLAKETAASHDAASVCAAMNRSISDDVTRRDAPI